MLLAEKEINVPMWKGNGSLLKYFMRSVNKQLSSNEIPIRFAITKTDSDICMSGGAQNRPVMGASK